MRLGLCCCGPGTDPELGLCGTTSTVPQPWPDRIYTLDISGGFGTVMMKVLLNGNGQDCPGGEPEPNCREEPIATYYYEPCCGPDEFGVSLRKAVYQGSTAFSGSFEFDSRGRANDTASCTRHIPVSASNVTQTIAYCPADTPGPTVRVTEIFECSKNITNCATGDPDFGARCLDASEIRVEFFAIQGTNYDYRANCADPPVPQCASAFITGSAIYRRVKSSTDTHVAVGAYSLVWSSAPYEDACTGNFWKRGCPGDSPFPRVITVGIKP